MTNSLNSLTVRENHVFKKNDFVRIINDQNRVKRLQRGHGEWADVMIKSLNKIGKIIDIYHDDDLKVLINGSFWTYNPQAVRFVFSFSTSGMISQMFIDEIVTIIRESNSPIDELWEGILKSDIDLGTRLLRVYRLLKDHLVNPCALHQVIKLPIASYRIPIF